MKVRKWKVLWLSIFLMLDMGFICAQDQIPQTTGFSGYVLTGPGIFNVKSNLLVSGPPLVQDVGQEQTNSVFDAPSFQTALAWPLAGEVNYTFAESRTQLFFGNRLEDILRLDVPFGLGIRQELKDSSIVALSALFTPLELKFWEDPYVEGEDRVKTGLQLPGLRFRWGKMFKTGLEFTATMRWYRYDRERSGEWLVGQGRLDVEEQPLLERNGRSLRLQLLYRFQWERHRLEPTFRYVDNNRDGGAVADSGYSLRMTYLYLSKKFLLDANMIYGRRDGKEIHPVYDQKFGADRLGVAMSVFVPIKFLNGKGWNIWISGELYNENANIDFFKSQLSAVMGGLMWRHRRP